MTRVRPLEPNAVSPMIQDAMVVQKSLLGLVPESLLTMAHKPRMASLFAELATEVLEPAHLDRGIKQLVALVSSSAAGCRYCQAHTAQSAEMVGVPLEKIENAFCFETSALFNEAERSALRLAFDSSTIPNRVTDEHFTDLKKYYDDTQIVEMVGVIALFGWLNRWNDTMDTTLEESPSNFVNSLNIR